MFCSKIIFLVAWKIAARPSPLWTRAILGRSQRFRTESRCCSNFFGGETHELLAKFGFYWSKCSSVARTIKTRAWRVKDEVGPTRNCWSRRSSKFEAVVYSKLEGWGSVNCHIVKRSTCVIL
jgi:hypothetical protein